MQIENFTIYDMEEMNSWYEKRGLPKFIPSLLPEMGFWVKGYAAIFVYMTDSDIALIDNLVSNPEADKTERRDAIRLLVNHAYQSARQVRSVVIAVIKNSWVTDLAKNTGYKSIGKYELFIKG